MFETFTKQAREAIVRARHEARDIGRGTVEVEHLLLGLFSHENDITNQVLADFGLTIQSVRDMVRKRLGSDGGSPFEGNLPFSPSAKDALRSAHRFGMGEPGTDHILVALVAHGEGGASEILKALAVDPKMIRFETKKRAWPSSVPKSGARPRGEVRGTIRSRLDELDFGPAVPD